MALPVQYVPVMGFVPVKALLPVIAVELRLIGVSASHTLYILLTRTNCMFPFRYKGCKIWSFPYAEHV